MLASSPYPSPEVVEAATTAVHRVLRATSRRHPPRDYARRLARVALIEAYFTAEPSGPVDARHRFCYHCSEDRSPKDLVYKEYGYRCTRCGYATVQHPAS